MKRSINMSSNKHLTLVAAALLTLAGCKLNATIDRNQAPVANAGPDQELPAGTTVVTLDGSGSRDPDGQVVRFIWQSVDPSITGIQEGVQTQVTLTGGDGAYGFNLWVRDAKGKTSAVDQVVIAVGVPLTDPLKGTEAGSGGSDFVAMPDDACLAVTMIADQACKDCVCTPNANGGCAEEVMHCTANPDANFAQLCTALFDCASMTGCKGADCYTGPCMTEVVNASNMDPAGMCNGAMPDLAPCSSAVAVATCRENNCSDFCP